MVWLTAAVAIWNDASIPATGRYRLVGRQFVEISRWMSTRRVAGFRYTNEAVGALVLVTVLIFVLALVQAGRIREWFDPGATIRVILPPAEGLFGLTEGAPVEILGTKAGEVRRIVLAPDQHIHAVIYIRKAMLGFVRRDSQAIIRKQFGVAGRHTWNSPAAVASPSTGDTRSSRQRPSARRPIP